MGMSAEEQNYVNALKAQSHAIRHMMGTEGWKLFDEVLAHSEKNAYEASSAATDAWNGAKHHGAYHAVKFIRTWAERQLEVIDKNIEAVTQSAIQRDLHR